MGLEQQMGK